MRPAITGLVLMLVMVPLLTLSGSGWLRARAAGLVSDSPWNASIRLPGPLARPPQQAAPVELALPTLTAASGETLSIDLQITTTQPTRAAQFSLAFDPGVLRCDGVLEGSFYANWAAANGAATLVFPQPVCDNTNGRVTPMGIILTGGTGGPPGAGVLATFNFTVLANGSSPLTLVDVIVADDSPQSNPLPVELIPGQVLVGIEPTSTLPATLTASATASLTPSPTPTLAGAWTCANADINLDGMVNIQDISLVSQKMFQTGPPGWIREDVNRDGVVNVLDITSTGSCMDELPTPTFTPTVTPTPVPEAHIWIDPGSQTVASGQVFTIQLMLNTIAPSRAAQFGLTFNPAVLRCNTVAEGTFYSSWAAANGASTLVLPQGTCDNTAGEVSVMGITVLGGTGGATGQGVVAAFEFTAIANGVSPLTLDDVIIADANQERSGALPLRISNGQVTVGNTAQPTATLTRTPTTSSAAPTATRTPTRTATTAGGFTPVVTTAVVNTAAPTSPSNATNTPPVSSTNTPAASGARFFFNPSLKTAAVGDTFEVELKLETDKASRSAMMQIRFSASILECTGVEEGGFYKTWATANGGITFLQPNPPAIDNAAGVIDYGVAILGADVDPSPGWAGGPTGSGVFLTLTFRAKANGISSLQMENILLGDGGQESQPLAVTAQTGQVFVGVTPTPTQQGAATATPTRTLPASGSTSYPTSPGSSLPTATLARTATPPTANRSGTPGTPAPSSTLPSGSGTATLASSTALTASAVTGTTTSLAAAPGEMPGSASPGPDSASLGVVDISASLDASGVMTEDVIVQSPDGVCGLTIPFDTQALTADNYPLDTVSLQSVPPAGLPAELQDGLAGLLCEFGPQGANFYPPARISLAYDAANLPVGVGEQDLTILVLDEMAGSWLPLESTLDPASQTVSTEVEHFSVYALQAVPTAFNWVPLILASLVVEVALALGVFFYLRYRRGGAVRKPAGPPLLLPPVAGESFYFSSFEAEPRESEELAAPLRQESPPRPSTQTILPKENEQDL